MTEYFVDRGYTTDGRLIDRREPGALLDNPAEAADRAVRAAREGVGESFCTHGDSPNAVVMARAATRSRRHLSRSRRSWIITAEWTATPDQNRVAVRPSGPSLARAITDELPSEGLIRGAIQVPASGHR